MRLRRLAPLSVAAVLLVVAAAPAAAQEPTPLVVVEVATVRAAPDTATVRGKIARAARSAAIARRRVERRVATVLRKLDALGVERADVRTELSSYRLRRRGRVRYVASTSVHVRTTELEKLGRILAAFGGASISGPEFEVSDSTAARQEATRTALQRTRRRADAAAAALGMRVVAIRKVDLNAEFNYDPSVEALSGGGTDDSGGGGGAAEIEPGRELVSVAVAVVYELAP